MEHPSVRSVLELIERSDCEDSARYLPLPQPRALLEPVSAESRGLNFVALRSLYRTGRYPG